MHRPFLAAAALLITMADSRADDNCAAIRAGIEAKIRSSGAANFSVSTVASDARVAGKVVGSCDRGARKIVYLPAATSAPTAPAARAAPAAPRAQDRIITECWDGSVSVGGDCPR